MPKILLVVNIHVEVLQLNIYINMKSAVCFLLIFVVIFRKIQVMGLSSKCPNSGAKK